MYVVKVLLRRKGVGLDCVICDIYLKIPRCKELSETRVRKILFCKGAGKSEREIARFIKHSKTAIHNVIIGKYD